MHESDSSAGGATTRQSKGTRRSDKGCQKIPKVMFQFIVLLAIANAIQAVPIMAELPVKVGPLPNNSGTYVELRNRIALMSAEWTIVSYFDLRLLAQEITAFKKNIEELSTWCLRGGSCPTVIQVLEQEASELYDGQQLFNHHRQRRGALNLVGNLANGLFVVLDSQYAQNMKEVIRRIQAKKLHNTHFLKNHTSILDSTINVMRTSNDEMERRVRHMETHVTDLENTIRTGNIAQVSSEPTLIAGHIKRTQTAVINIITGLKRGIVSPALISVSQLQKELINIQAHLLKGRRLRVAVATQRTSSSNAPWQPFNLNKNPAANPKRSTRQAYGTPLMLQILGFLLQHKK